MKLIGDYMTMVSSSLASKTSMMKADGIIALAYLLEKFKDDVTNSLSKSISEIILMLQK